MLRIAFALVPWSIEGRKSSSPEPTRTRRADIARGVHVP